MYNTLSPLLAEHGLVIIPRCMERIESQRPSGQKTLYFVAVKMEFDFVCAEDGSKHTACTYGEAMDSGDKATNKAMSIAYKYACFQIFAIPTEGDNDPDATVHEPAPARKPQQSAPSADSIIAAINKADAATLNNIINDVHSNKAAYNKQELELIKGAINTRKELFKQAAQTTANGLQLNDGFKAQA